MYAIIKDSIQVYTFNEKPKFQRGVLAYPLKAFDIIEGVVEVVEFEDTAKPETTQLQQVVRAGVKTDANGNNMQAWRVVPMFTSDLLDEDGVTVLKTIAEQEAEYLANKAAQEAEEEAKLVETTIQTILNDSAKSRGYDSIISECSYATSTGAFGAEAQITVDWRDAVWTYVYSVQSTVEAGGVKPAIEELIAGLPVRGLT